MGCTSSAEAKDKEVPAPDALPSARVHRDVTERVVAFLSVSQRACARRGSKALWKAVTAESMEDMLRATVLEHRDTRVVDGQLVVVAMSSMPGSFSSADALVAWSGGLGPLYDELQLRFPHATVIGISARLAAIRPFPFTSGTVMTVCVVSAVASTPSALVIESVVLGIRDAMKVVVCNLSRDCPVYGTPCSCPILCLEGAIREQFANEMHDVSLPSLPPLRTIGKLALWGCESLQSITLTNLPTLKSIDDYAFDRCARLSTVDLSSLPSLRSIGKGAFSNCESLQSIRLADLPRLKSIGDHAFAECAHLSTVNLSELPLCKIWKDAFQKCKSLQSISLANLPLLESIDDSGTVWSMHRYFLEVFQECEYLQSASLANLPLLKSIGICAFHWCRLSSIVLSSLPSLRTIWERAFSNCESLQSIRLADLPRLKSIGDHAFDGCAHLSTVDLSSLPSLRTIGMGAFRHCESLQSISLAKLPLLKRIGACVCFSSVDVYRLRSCCLKYKRCDFA